MPWSERPEGERAKESTRDWSVNHSLNGGNSSANQLIGHLNKVLASALALPKSKHWDNLQLRYQGRTCRLIRALTDSQSGADQRLQCVASRLYPLLNSCLKIWDTSRIDSSCVDGALQYEVRCSSITETGDRNTAAQAAPYVCCTSVIEMCQWPGFFSELKILQF